MRFLVDRCAGRRLAEWLRQQGHDVVEVRSLGPDPGDRAILDQACRDGRVLITIDTDFGKHVFVDGDPHAGVVRLPDVPSARRIELMAQVLDRKAQPLRRGAIVTVRGNKIRVSMR